MSDTITIPRGTAQQALEALIDAANVLSAPMFADAVDALRTALQQQAEPLPREGFEKWAKSRANYIDLSRFETGYSDCNTDYAWAGWQAALAQRQQQAKPPTCVWSPEDEGFMPGTYRSACGELWSYVDGGWKDNRVNFCHGCGGKVVEAAHHIQEAKP